MKTGKLSQPGPDIRARLRASAGNAAVAASTVAALVAAAWPQFVSAQQPSAPVPQQPAPAQQAAPQQFQQSSEWSNLPKMVLERQFAGPLQDTVIQRMRDPVDGTVCHLYLPISAPHSPTTATGFVQYGPNGIGAITCMPGRPVAASTSQGQKK